MKKIDMSLLTEPASKCSEREVCFHGCIVCDVLSYAIAHAEKGQIWITHHTHPNIIAVAVLKELAAVIVAGGGKPDSETVRRAEEEGIPFYVSSRQAYDLAKWIASNDKDWEENPTAGGCENE
jgi:hypothetical protein